MSTESGPDFFQHLPRGTQQGSPLRDVHNNTQISGAHLKGGVAGERQNVTYTFHFTSIGPYHQELSLSLHQSLLGVWHHFFLLLLSTPPVVLSFYKGAGWRNSRESAEPFTRTFAFSHSAPSCISSCSISLSDPSNAFDNKSMLHIPRIHSPAIKTTQFELTELFTTCVPSGFDLEQGTQRKL